MPTEVTLIISNEYLHDLGLTKQLTPDFPYTSQGLTFSHQLGNLKSTLTNILYAKYPSHFSEIPQDIS